MNNKFLQGFLVCLAIITMVGCSSILKNNEGVFGKQSKTTDKVQSEMRATENAQAQVNEDRLSHIGAYAKGGVEYSLSKVPSTNITPEISVAQQMNDRVEALAGKPDFKEVEAIKTIVDDLTSQNKEIQKQGEKLLAVKDKEINRLEGVVKDLNTQRENQIADLNAVADASAAKADQYKATLGQMDRFFGLGAVFYGLKRFIVSAAWILGIGSVLFLILRLLASSNPIAASIFAIFDQIGSWFVNAIKVIFPKAVSLAGHVTKEVYDSAHNALSHVVDCVETVKLQNGGEATIQDLLDTAELSMTPADKALIDEIKVKLGWVKVATKSTIPSTPSAPSTPTTTTPASGSVG